MDQKDTSNFQDVQSAARSHIGASPLRPLLEDRSRSERIRTGSGLEMVLGVVADGIGGENAGERAAEITVNTIFEVCEKSKDSNIPKMLKEALGEANARVYAEARRSRRKMHMGSTAAVAAVVDDRLYIANVGDSRIYLIHGNRARQLTMDHTWANEVVRSGSLSNAEAAKHPRRDEIVRSIGFEKSLEVDLGIWLQGGEESDEEARAVQGIPLQKGDRVLICSDGVTKSRHDKPGSHYVEVTEIPHLVEGKSPEQAVGAIIKQTRSRKVDDNVSAVVIQVGSDEFAKRTRFPFHILGGSLLLIMLLAALIWSVPEWLKKKPKADFTPVPAELPAGVAYLSDLTGFAEKQTAGGIFKGLQEEEILTSGQGVRIRTLGNEANLRLEMADQSVLYLGPDSQIELRAIGDGNSIFVTFIVLEQGSVLVFKAEETGVDFIVASPIGIQARAVGSLMGVLLELSLQRVHVDCFHARCSIEGMTSFELKTGEHLWMASNGQLGEVGFVRHALYAFGGDLISEPTAIVQNTVVKVTASPTQTLKALFIPPTLTFTPIPTRTPKPPPTQTLTKTPTDTLAPSDTPIPSETPQSTKTPHKPPPPTDTETTPS